MAQAHKDIPTPQAILEAWQPFQALMGVTSIKTEEDYERVVAIVDSLGDIVRSDEDHPLADVLHYFGDLVERYEDEHVPIPDASPREMLRFFIEQHGLKQEDLADCVAQSKLSEILAGKRSISKAMAKKLAQRFHVSADLFL
jgi:HTH-type transcriptional regulator/antitoxin HigA